MFDRSSIIIKNPPPPPPPLTFWAKLHRIFAKSICLEYLRNSQMVLSYFGINVSENLIVSPNFFRSKSPLKFWGSCRHSKRHINCFLFCWTVIVWFVKTENRLEAYGLGSPQSSGTVMYWTCLCEQSRYWKSDWWVFIKKKSV